MGTVSHVFTSTVHALLRGRYDVVHLHALAPGLAAPLYRRFDVPTVATVHGIDWQRAKWKGLGACVLRQAERWLVRSVDELITVSNDLEEYYRTTYGRGSSLIPNGTDLTPDAPLDAALLERLGLAPEAYVLFVARLVPEKRPEDLIRAFRGVETRVRLAVVGDSSHTDAYAAALRQEAASDPRVVFTGVQPRANVETLFRGAAAFVLPSELEGMSMALLQALEMGVPSIVSGLPVHHELLDRIEGYDLFFEAGDVTALRERLHRLLTQRDRYRRVALRAQATSAAHSWPAIAEQTERLYQRLSSGAAAATSPRGRPTTPTTRWRRGDDDPSHRRRPAAGGAAAAAVAHARRRRRARRHGADRSAAPVGGRALLQRRRARRRGRGLAAPPDPGRARGHRRR
jgi:glycosyltransferase involved in cell wall biosynthesis